MIKFHCPSCTAKLEIESEAAGQQITCPQCSALAVVPLPSTTIKPQEDQETGLIGWLEQLLIIMIRGIFRFVFIDSPQKILHVFVRSFPWLIRVVRVVVIALTWVAISLWPLLTIRWLPEVEHPSFEGAIKFLATHHRLIVVISYIYVVACIAGSIWGVVKWINDRDNSK